MDEPSNYPIAIIIGDVNGLKLTNDAFGHLAGDRLLAAAAESLRRVLKDKDVLARWGGDEFIMLLPNTDMEEANSIIHDINHDNKKTFVDSINLSISFGYAVKYNNGYDMSIVMKQADDMMYKEKLSISRSVKNRTVNIILQSLYVKNPSEREHSMGVSRLADKLGVILGLGNSDIIDLRVLGQIHDVGKITIEDGILNKPDKLTEAEYEIVTRHSEKGYQIIKASPELMYLAEEVLSHHERYDGTGYPRGLKREEIPKLARILAVADAIEAMLSDKPYRKALTMEQIIQELRANAGTQFDPEVVEASFKILTI
ncbi:HD domain-containing phosphohydrolase [Clostridium sp. KNHs205]|uniref:HD-GYP domain-containing protein n=1 Tax=Clostridium sp. KNHs205 TaxID=1449050 RepID=UPI000AB87A96|nr:HD domain-containing phosphohydrolase [Clostridium sp. KNHs205]